MAFQFLLFLTLCQVMPPAWSQSPWPHTGNYRFTAWDGPDLKLHYSIPSGSPANSPILIVIPGARRNADAYRDQWHDLAMANRFITLVLEAALENYPTEYEYNLGGVISASGEKQPEKKWLFSAIEPLFDDFVERFGSTRKTYDLYGHSAGGGFVHRFLLFKPDAKVRHAVAANPAFATMSNEEVDYPFGLRDAPISDRSLAQWFNKKLIVLLGERDLGPRTKPLSNGPQARSQGPHVYARGLKFFQSSLARARSEHLKFAWQLEVVPNVGHSNAHMASHAVKYLCQD